MNSRNYVNSQIPKLKASLPLQDAAWELATLTIGWPYIFGDRGQYCTPDHRRAVYNKHGGDKLIERCQVLNKSKSSCSGCKWLPGGEKVLAFDCRGFTYWVLLKIYGWKLEGTGCTQQWNLETNWKLKGEIAVDGIPEDTLVCLFHNKIENKKVIWEHTGFGYHGETIECQLGVEYYKQRKAKWTHWGVPACIEGDIPTPTPPDPDKKPTLRRGSSGKYVTLLQATLIQRGYDCGSTGADGKYGAKTEEAVRRFQKDHPPLVQDGICGPATWAALDDATDPQLYTVHIPMLPLFKAEAIISQYSGAWMTKEGGDA